MNNSYLWRGAAGAMLPARVRRIDTSSEAIVASRPEAPRKPDRREPQGPKGSVC
jgi:hypothetical protein